MPGTKGFPELLTAMARLRDDGFPVRLTLVGDGNWKRKLVEMAQAPASGRSGGHAGLRAQ